MHGHSRAVAATAKPSQMKSGHIVRSNNMDENVNNILKSYFNGNLARLCECVRSGLVLCSKISLLNEKIAEHFEFSAVAPKRNVRHRKAAVAVHSYIYPHKCIIHCIN